ncbi:MAG TPA: hypothetical protein VFB21_20620 [Chthonomonadaceae bacterium]|nr:hypothetical protein [Chthonomonadaceae bacterium]
MRCRIALYVLLPSVLACLLPGAARAGLVSLSACAWLESGSDVLLPNPADPVENGRYTPQNPSGASSGLAGDFVRIDLGDGWCLWMRREQRWPWGGEDAGVMEAVCGAQPPGEWVRNDRNALVETYEPTDAASYHGKIPLENVLCGGRAAARNGGNGHGSGGGADPNARHRR